MFEFMSNAMTRLPGNWSSTVLMAAVPAWFAPITTIVSPISYLLHCFGLIGIPVLIFFPPSLILLTFDG